MTIEQLKAGQADRGSLFASALLFLLPVSALTFPSGPTPLQVLILLAVAWAAFAKPRFFSARHSRTLAWVFAAFAGYFAVSLARKLAFHHGWNIIDGPLRLLLALSCIVFVMRFRPRLQWLYYGICAGAIGAGAFALVQRFAFGMERVLGPTHHAITFGDLAMASSVMALCMLTLSRKPLHTLLAVAATAMGTAATALSGTRGAWIGSLFALIALLACRRERGGREVRLFLAVAALFCLAFSIAYFIPQTELAARTGKGIDEIRQYLHNGDATTSVGIRLELWKASLVMFMEHPLIGAGRDAFHAQLQLLAGQGRLQQSPALAFSSSHNDVLYFLATGGLLDFSFLLLMYFAPLALFFRALNSADAESRSAALAGILLVVCFIGFGLTDVMFWLMLPKVFYGMMVCTLIGFCLSRQAANPFPARVSATGPAHEMPEAQCGPDRPQKSLHGRP